MFGYTQRFIACIRHEYRPGGSGYCFFYIAGCNTIYNVVHFETGEVIHITAFLYKIQQFAFADPAPKFYFLGAAKCPGRKVLFNFIDEQVTVISAIVGIELYFKVELYLFKAGVLYLKFYERRYMEPQVFYDLLEGA